MISGTDLRLLERMAADSRARVRGLLAVAKYKKASPRDREEARKLARQHAQFSAWAYEFLTTGGKNE